MADELIGTDVETEGDLLGDNAETPDKEEAVDDSSEDEALKDSPEAAAEKIEDSAESSDAEVIENSSDAIEEEASEISADVSDADEITDSSENAPLDLPALDGEPEPEQDAGSELDIDLEDLQMGPIGGEEPDGADEEDEDEEPPEPKPVSVKLTDDELAALDAEIAAQLDAEAEQGDSGDEWYFVHTYSGMENKVKKNLEHRIESMGMANLILQVVVPTETEVEIRKGVRKEVEKRVFPGYILVNMVVDEDSWYVVRNTPGVTGFVGMGNKPTPLSPDEVSRIMERLDADEPVIKVSFELGEQVRITGGPFAEFNGIVEEIYADKGKAKVMVSFFNRETPVEVDFVQLEREE